jgi:hypothetical protein
VASGSQFDACCVHAELSGSCVEWARAGEYAQSVSHGVACTDRVHVGMESFPYIQALKTENVVVAVQHKLSGVHSNFFSSPTTIEYKYRSNSHTKHTSHTRYHTHDDGPQDNTYTKLKH